MDVYYHYTTPQSAESIIRSGVIKMSTKKAKRRDARHGSGVYLTQVPPTTPRYWIAFNNYDGINPAAIAQKMVQKGEYADTVTGTHSVHHHHVDLMAW